LLATGIDYTVFLLLIGLDFDAVKAHYVSASLGMLVNFLVQNQYVFLRERALLTTFLLSMTVSVIGITLGGFLMGWIQQFPFWNAHLYLAKIVVTGLIFFYNFYLKRFVFEKRFL
jgi:putative flippase GtrA